MECWPPARRACASERIVGMKSGKRTILQEVLNLNAMMMHVRHPFSAFAPKIMQLLREYHYNYIRSDSLKPPFHYPRTHDSNIPIFQHSKWSETPNLRLPTSAHRTVVGILFNGNILYRVKFCTRAFKKASSTCWNPSSLY